MAPLPFSAFPTMIPPANTSITSFTATLPLGSFTSPTAVTLGTPSAPSIETSFCDESCPEDLISGITRDSRIPESTLFVSPSTTTSESGPTQTPPGVIEGPADPTKQAESPSGKNTDSCGSNGLKLTDDDKFMCVQEGGHARTMTNSEVLAKIRAAKSGDATPRKLTSEDIDALKRVVHEIWFEQNRVIAVWMLRIACAAGFVLIPIYQYKALKSMAASVRENKRKEKLV